MDEKTMHVVAIDTKEFFRKTMVLAPYEDFAELIALTVSQSDEPKQLADAIIRHLTTDST